MSEDPPPLVCVHITTDPPAKGEILEVWARIGGDPAIYGDNDYRAFGVGNQWHRQRWAAENYARQLQVARPEILRTEIARIEGYRFGRQGS